MKKMKDRISEHISYSESIFSQTAQRLGVSNEPDHKQLQRMKLLAEKVFEPLRKAFGKPIYISSFFRSHAVNTAIGGSLTSQHMQGEAMDISSGEMNAEIFHWLKNNVEFDQLIWEFGDNQNPAWVHVSYTAQRPNRQEVLIAYSQNGRTAYKHWKE